MPTLIELLLAAETAINAKNKTTLNSKLDGVLQFLSKALDRLEVNSEDKALTIEDILDAKDNENKELVELQGLLHSIYDKPIAQDNSHNIYLFNQILNLCNTKIFNRNNKLTSFEADLTHEVIELSLNEPPYNLGFLAPSYNTKAAKPTQTPLGKYPEHGQVVFTRMLKTMDARYWKSDDYADVSKMMPYLTSTEKKQYKVEATGENNALERRGSKGRPMSDGVYLYAVSPKGSLYAIGSDDEKREVHHSGIRAGQPIICAGHITLSNGRISSITQSSGHYKPTLKNLIITSLHLHAQGILDEQCIVEAHGGEKKILLSDVLTRPEYAYYRDLYEEIKSDRTQIPTNRSELFNEAKEQISPCIQRNTFFSPQQRTNSATPLQESAEIKNEEALKPSATRN